MIPKKIHYCWFGRGEKSQLARKCIASWKRFCPDYEIIEWNEDNFNIDQNAYTKFCYENKKWAFLSDYVRLLVVEEFGGIYFDTDVEVLVSFDDLRKHSAFFGFENSESVNTGLGFGAEAHHPAIQKMLEEYASLLDGQYGTVMCPKLNTEALLKFGLQTNGRKQMLEDMAVYPVEYFNPYDSITGRLKKTEDTYSVHWYSASWLSPKQRIRSMISKPFHRIFGTDCFDFLKK